MKTKEKIKKFMKEEKPFVIFINKQFANKKGLTGVYVITQYPEGYETIKPKRKHIEFTGQFKRYIDCECDNCIIDKPQKRKIPYSKIETVDEIPEFYGDNCLAVNYICEKYFLKGAV